MKFEKTALQDIVAGDGDAKIIEEKITDVTRWSILYTTIFKWKDKYYLTHYSVGATEYQPELPYEDEGPEIECAEVEPYEATITAYRLKV